MATCVHTQNVYQKALARTVGLLDLLGQVDLKVRESAGERAKEKEREHARARGWRERKWDEEGGGVRCECSIFDVLM